MIEDLEEVGEREDKFEGGCPQTSGATECEQLQKEWDKSGHLC